MGIFGICWSGARYLQKIYFKIVDLAEIYNFPAKIIEITRKSAPKLTRDIKNQLFKIVRRFWERFSKWFREILLRKCRSRLGLGV